MSTLLMESVGIPCRQVDNRDASEENCSRLLHRFRPKNPRSFLKIGIRPCIIPVISAGISPSTRAATAIPETSFKNFYEVPVLDSPSRIRMLPLREERINIADCPHRLRISNPRSESPQHTLDRSRASRFEIKLLT